MDRRAFHRSLFSGLLARPLFGQEEADKPPAKYEASWESLRQHPMPAWYRDAKLGIFIHWGLYSVPAWAPPSGELGKVDFSKWFYQNPYAEWYLNSIRLNGTPSRKHHEATYGADFDYYRFAETFNRETEKWQPGEWADLFREVGARYVVLTTKHHDGFTLWPSRVRNPKRAEGIAARRDLVGELTQAVRSKGLRMGLYYSGGLDWTFETTPVAAMGDLRRTVPQTEEYAAYADAHWRELIERYQPAVLWNDINYPKAGRLREIFSDYYTKYPEGLVNNRFGVEHFDFTTPEYSRYDRIVEKKWETCRGLGFSFGYNQVEGSEHVLSADKLVALLVDIVSKNGNLLLNIGPRPDGSISQIQLDRLRELGKWLKVNGEGIFGASPWIRHGGRNPLGQEVRYTRKDDRVYAWFLDRPAGKYFVAPGVMVEREASVTMLGGSGMVTHKQNGPNVEFTVHGKPPAEYAVGFRITPAPYQLVRE